MSAHRVFVLLTDLRCSKIRAIYKSHLPPLISLMVRVDANRRVYFKSHLLSSLSQQRCHILLCGITGPQAAGPHNQSAVNKDFVTTMVRRRRRDHVTPLLKELHWLPVKFRCQYKIATLAYRHFDGSLPPYLSSSLCTYEPSRSLRSSNEKLLKIPKRKLKSFGHRSFSFMAPSLWNSLPATLRNVPTLSQFKSHLKTFLFAGFPVESSTLSEKKMLRVCVCGWIHMNRDWGRREGDNTRDLGKSIDHL